MNCWLGVSSCFPSSYPSLPARSYSGYWGRANFLLCSSGERGPPDPGNNRCTHLLAERKRIAGRTRARPGLAQPRRLWRSTPSPRTGISLGARPRARVRRASRPGGATVRLRCLTPSAHAAKLSPPDRVVFLRQSLWPRTNPDGARRAVPDVSAKHNRFAGRPGAAMGLRLARGQWAP
jgi:hypothetical protein